MKEKINQLLQSVNIDDQVLGLIFMMKENLLFEMFTRKPVYAWYDMEYQLNEVVAGDTGTFCIISENIFFFPGENDFIGHISKETLEDRGNIENLLTYKCLYNDESIKL